MKILGDERMFKAFQSFGAMTEKALSPMRKEKERVKLTSILTSTLLNMINLLLLTH